MVHEKLEQVLQDTPTEEWERGMWDWGMDSVHMYDMSVCMHVYACVCHHHLFTPGFVCNVSLSIITGLLDLPQFMLVQAVQQLQIKLKALA